MQQNTNLKIQPIVEREFSSLDITYEEDHELAWFRMNAKPRSCFTLDLLQSIHNWFVELQTLPKHSSLQYIVLSSQSSGVFNLGGDLNLFMKLINDKDRDGLMHYALACIDVLFLNHTGINRDLTTLALIQGDALGGGFEAAISSDVVIAERSAKMGMPEVLFNLFPGMGAYSFLVRKVGESQAEKMILGGKLYTAEEMYEAGIVDILVEDGNGQDAVYDYIKKENRAKNGFQAFRKAKRCCNPVTYEELEAITTIWVDAALQLRDKDLRMMERLVKRQSAKVG